MLASTVSSICLAICSSDADGTLAYEGDWALTRVDEKRAFEKFVDFVMARWAQFPSLHVYHYAPYEPAALKRLMGRYATRQEEIDRMLRAGLFVDLYQNRAAQSARQRRELFDQAARALLRFYPRNPAQRSECRPRKLPGSSGTQRRAFDRQTTSRLRFCAYNEDDCRSAANLRDWLEAQRAKLVADGIRKCPARSRAMGRRTKRSPTG